MEETDVCHPITSSLPVQPPVVVGCPAKALTPPQRWELAVHALSGHHTITHLAAQFQVSRKFVYQQMSTAGEALEQAFAPALDADDHVLFHLPVTQSWLRQVVLSLVLSCHSSYRGVSEFMADLLDYRLAIGTVHNVVQEAVAPARAANTQADLSAVRIGAHDEIFQAGKPVLVGVDVFSSYCYLFSLEEHRDADTWGVRLLELQPQGFAPEAIIADAGPGLRAGQAQALPDTPCRSDVFHALKEAQQVVTFLENRGYHALAACEELQRQRRRHRRHGRFDNRLAAKLLHARTAQAQAVALADDVALLVGWLRQDILGVAGPAYADRQALYDFILAELQARAAACPHRLRPLIRYLKNQRDELLAFAAQLDHDLAGLAGHFQVAPEVVREMLAVQTLRLDSPQRYRREAPLRQQLRGRYFPLSQAVEEVRRRTVRASSVVENFNSRARNYFFLRHQLGPDYLHLLQFFLNHHRFVRSEHPERVGRSPAELLSGKPHPHWLEMLGHQRFRRN
jgi:hypothetical protein